MARGLIIITQRVTAGDPQTTYPYEDRSQNRNIFLSTLNRPSLLSANMLATLFRATSYDRIYGFHTSILSSSIYVMGFPYDRLLPGKGFMLYHLSLRPRFSSADGLSCASALIRVMVIC